MRRVVMLLAGALILAACSGNVFDLEVGQCFDEPDSLDEVSNVEIVDCTEAHDNEVYHLFDLPDGDFPGDIAVGEAAVEGCLGTFEGYVGLDYESSALDIRYLIPTADSWSDGDQEVVCYLVDLNGAQLTGSMKGSGV